MKKLSLKYYLFFISLLIFFSLLFIAYFNSKNKGEYKSTIDVCESLKVEVFCLSNNGAFGSEIKSNYLTDSINFRVFVGKYDEGTNYYSYKCNNDTIIIKYKLISESNDADSTIFEKKYLIKKLKEIKNIKDDEAPPIDNYFIKKDNQEAVNQLEIVKPIQDTFIDTTFLKNKSLLFLEVTTDDDHKSFLRLLVNNKFICQIETHAPGNYNNYGFQDAKSTKNGFILYYQINGGSRGKFFEFEFKEKKGKYYIRKIHTNEYCFDCKPNAVENTEYLIEDIEFCDFNVFNYVQ
jgi:hypothetical protein